MLISYVVGRPTHICMEVYRNQDANILLYYTDKHTLTNSSLFFIITLQQLHTSSFITHTVIILFIKMNNFHGRSFTVKQFS